MGAISDGLLRLGVGQLEIVEEATFGTTPSSGWAYLETLGQVDVSGLHRPHVPSEVLRGAPDDPHQDIYAPAGTVEDGATVTTRHYLAGYSSTVPTSSSDITTDAAAYPLALVMEALLGGVSVGTLGTTDTGSDVDTIVTTSASGFDAGEVVAVDADGAGDYQASVISEVSGASLELREDLEDSAASGEGVYGSVTAYAADTLSVSVSLRWTGWLESSSTPLRVVLAGCVPESATITITPRELPTVEITWRVGSATWDDSASSGSGYSAWAYARPEMVVDQRAEVFSTADGAKLSALCFESATIQIDNDLQSFRCAGSTGGVYTHKLGTRKVTWTLRRSYVGEAGVSYATGGEFAAKFVLGTQPGRMVVLESPTLYTEDLTGPSDESGYAYADVTWRAMRYAGDTAGGSAAANHTFLVAFV